jgi:GntR family transcriptional regulator
MANSPPALTGHDFTAGARAAVADARRQATMRNDGAVGTEHLLLALAEKPVGRLANLLVSLGVDSSRIRSAVASIDETDAPREKTSRRERRDSGPPFTESAKRVLTGAMDEARALGDSSVGTEHLLLALCADEGSRAASALRSVGLSHARLHEAMRDLRSRRAGDVSAARPDTSFRVVIDDTSNRSIYEQIVARIQEGIATAALRPGDRLPTVRQLADELDVAPGTVARAYAELERAGAIITDGARGTRCASRVPSPAPRPDLQPTLVGLLRPVAVAAFHLGATADGLEAALTEAMRDIFPPAA